MSESNLVGTNIMGYKVIEKLGTGAYGTVYKVVKTNPAGQYVRALKHISLPDDHSYYSILESMAGDLDKVNEFFSDELKKIINEIKILNKLSEQGVSNIVRYYESDIITRENPRRYEIFILMEYLNTLEDYLENRLLTVNDVLNLGLNVLKGLSNCHDSGIIHRDIKINNIFVSESGEFKIGDFGISKIIENNASTFSIKGTPNYIAPEVYLGKEYSYSVDLYSLGIVLYRLLNYNRNPFLPVYPKQYFIEDENIAFEKRIAGNVPEPPVLGGEKIGEVILKSISSTNRYLTANEFADGLKKAKSLTNPAILNSQITVQHNPYKNKNLDETMDQFSLLNLKKENVDTTKEEIEFVTSNNQQNISQNNTSQIEPSYSNDIEGSDIQKNDKVMENSGFTYYQNFEDPKEEYNSSVKKEKKKKKNKIDYDPNSTLIKKEPYVLALEIYDSARDLASYLKSSELRQIVKDIRTLKEKLSVESDFGLGEKRVIDCENDIAKVLQNIQDTLLIAEEDGTLENYAISIKKDINAVKKLLRIRTELKKRS